MIVLDTHVWLWWLSNPELLSPKAAGVIEKAVAGGEVHISSISAWEIAMLVDRGRLELTIDWRDWIRKSESLPFITFVPVDNTIALRSVSLPGDFHQDPADRIIVATALTLGAGLVSRDGKIRKYSQVKTIW
ncbi:MAG: type II toxin-antitoxin system VapC family toxin [Proteobacteria bacterium]|nr:type II toxin-antitoxin system VapC family toxin [Pseudomonadota bacterium]MBU1687902.1 type II toxin-antitoxin system VapC family toxin [Pseudomonadota bacterium]